jgi:hypothetical protein
MSGLFYPIQEQFFRDAGGSLCAPRTTGEGHSGTRTSQHHTNKLNNFVDGL